MRLTRLRTVSTSGGRRSSVWLATAFVLVCSAAFADTVIRRDGRQMEGKVLSLDAEYLLLRSGPETIRVPRSEVASIQFEKPATPLKVEIRNIRSDDSLDVLLDDEPVIVEAREGGKWIDLTPKLKKGNNPLRLRIRNDRGTWAYRFAIRINGVVTTYACGTPYDRNQPCTCCGKEGQEIGVIDDLPVIWLFVDREAGLAEVMR